jgi:hypothetical protein
VPKFFRRLLVPLTATWVSLHVLVVTGTTITVLATAISSSDIVCTCAQGADHDSCPMHGTRADSTRCRLQSTQNNLGVALVSVLGPTTLTVTSTHAIAETSASLQNGYDAALPLDWTVPPESPPPRS